MDPIFYYTHLLAPSRFCISIFHVSCVVIYQNFVIYLYDLELYSSAEVVARERTKAQRSNQTSRTNARSRRSNSANADS